MKKSNNTISNWLKEHGDPEIDKFVEKNVAITEKVRHALILKGWNQGGLAQAMGKNPSEVTKWLSGMHNLTLKSIVKMEQALEIELSTCTPISEVEYTALTINDQVEYSVHNTTEYTFAEDDVVSYHTEFAL